MNCSACFGLGFRPTFVDGIGETDPELCPICEGIGKVTIDVVVVNYRTPADLAKFIESTKHAPDHTLTIVDVDPLEPVEPPDRSVLLRVDENIGYARACNFAATKCTNPVIAFFNADVQLTPGALEHCVQLLLHRDEIAVVGPRQVDSNRRLTHAGIIAKKNGGAMPRGFHAKDTGQYATIEDMKSVSGSAFVVKRRVFDELAACPLYREIDPMSEGAFLQTEHFFEETWVSYHAAAHDYRIVYDGTVTMIHEWHRASPVGSQGGAMRRSQRFFRQACDVHGITHD